MPTSAPFRLNRSGVLLALISAAFAGEAAAAAGRVDFTTGGVTVAGRDGQARPLTRGAELDSGDTVKTNDGRAQIRFTDGSYVSLQPNTDFAISEYKYEGKNDGSERGFFGLLKGAMRTVTGAVGKSSRDAYKITTPTATVGIRGTGGVIQVLNDGSTLVIGTSGIWSLTNPAGSIDVPAGVSGLAPTEPNTPPRESSTQPQTSTPPVKPVNEIYTQGNNVNSDGTADIGLTYVPLVTGDGYAPAIAVSHPSQGTIIDGGDGGEGNRTGSAVFNPQGQLTELMLGSNSYKLAPGGTHADFGSDGVLAWGRWIGAVTMTGGNCAAPTGCTTTFNENQGFHYVIGMPTPLMPTSGIATYSLLGATRPTYVDGLNGPGTFNGTITVHFGADGPNFHSLSGSFSAVMPDKTLSWNASGTATSPYFYMFNSGSVSGCISSGCSANMTGFFSGANAERAGVSYKIIDSREVIGAAGFKKNP